MPSLIEGSVRGNFGVLDVLAALHWIQDNIGKLKSFYFLLMFINFNFNFNLASFGGDRTRVTLCGHKRGAAMVQFLMNSSLSKGKIKFYL